MTKLTDVCDIQYGYAFDSKCFSNDETLPPLVRIRDVKRGYSETFYSGEYPEEYIIHAGDLLVGMDGEFNIARWKSRDALLNQRVCKIVAKDGTNEEYIRFFLSTTLKEIEKRTSFVTVKHLSAKELNKIEINIPNINEQTRIAISLRTLENIITHRRTQLEKLDLLVKARFVEMFGDVTSKVPLSFYIDSLTAGKSLASEDKCINKVLKTGAVSYDYFDETQIKYLPIDYTPLKEHLVKSGDVIISRMNTAELVGAAAYVWNVEKNIYLPDRLWRAEIKESVNPIFLWQILIQQTTKNEMRRIAGGTSGSMKNISKSGLLGINVVNVPLDLQTQFADFVKQVDKSRFITLKENKESEIL